MTIQIGGKWSIFNYTSKNTPASSNKRTTKRIRYEKKERILPNKTKKGGFGERPGQVWSKCKGKTCKKNTTILRSV
jgi:hypothetical protein